MARTPSLVMCILTWILLCIVVDASQDNKGHEENSPSGEDTYNCEASKGHFKPLQEGQCPAGTTWAEKHKCCVQCIYCPPGQRKALTGCLSSCVPCEEGFFSSKVTMGTICQPCRNCEDKNLVTLKKCFPDQDTTCGDCPPGYYNISTKDNNMPQGVYTTTSSIGRGCVRCMEHTTAYECLIHFQAFHKEEIQRQQKSLLPWQVSTIILGTLLGLTLLSVLVATVVWNFSSCHKGKSKTIRRPHNAKCGGDTGSIELPSHSSEDNGSVRLLPSSDENLPPVHEARPDIQDSLFSSLSKRNPNNCHSVPSNLNRISVKIDIPPSAVPELMKYVPALFNENGVHYSANVQHQPRSSLEYHE